MKKIKQTSLDQTGVAIYTIGDEEKVIPLFSLNPIEEANKMYEYFIAHTVKKVMLEHVFLANNLLEYKIEDEIDKFLEKHGYLPEDLMNELVCGFPFSLISGYNNFSKKFYA